MKFTIFTLLFFTVIFSSNIFAQRGSNNSEMRIGYSVIGSVKDKQSEKFIEYANIVII